MRNRRLGKRDCTLLIRDIWREKAANDAEVSPDLLHSAVVLIYSAGIEVQLLILCQSVT